MIICGILFIVFLLIGVMMSYNGNPIQGYVAIWCNITHYHQKQWKKNPKVAFNCKRCGGLYYKGTFTIV